MKRWIKVAAAGLVLAVFVDRLVLYAWAWQIVRFYKTLHTVAETAAGALPPGRPYVSFGLEPLLVIPKNAKSAVSYLTLDTDSWLVQPSNITVDGMGGLHLRFLPPALAWSTRLLPRWSEMEHADPVNLDPRYYYEYKIAVEPTAEGRIHVSLQHGPFHFSDPVKPDQLRPALFP